MAFIFTNVFDMVDVMDGRNVVIRVFQCGDQYTFDNCDRWFHMGLVDGTTMLYAGPVAEWRGWPMYFEFWGPEAPEVLEDGSQPVNPATPVKRLRQ